MLQKLIVRHCAPTLAGLKSGSMFSCECSDTQEMKREIREINNKLGAKGLRVIPLRLDGPRALIYVFRPARVQKDLEHETACSLLHKAGYSCTKTGSCVTQLIEKLRLNGEFPHEIGLFLGYPPEDVSGFIENGAKGHKCSGLWKVYGDEKAAQKTFERYKKCSAVYQNKWLSGRSLEMLTVAS